MVSVLLAGLLFTAFPVYTQQPELQSHEQALEWAASYPGHPQLPDVLIFAISSAPTMEAIESIIREHITSVAGPTEQARVAHAAGRLFELANRLDQARRYYGEALQLDAQSEESALRFASVTLEQGNLDEAIMGLRRIVATSRDRTVQRRAAILRAYAMHLNGQSEEALAHARALAGFDLPASAAPPLVEAAAYTLLVEIATAMDRSTLVLQAQERMATIFPGSPEVILATPDSGERRITYYAGPSRLLGGGQTVASTQNVTVREAPRQSHTEPIVTGIQTGSFRDRENADYMALDIQDLGFDAVVREVSVDGAPFYRVIVPVTADTDSTARQRLIVSLKERGIEGFLIFGEP